MRKIMIIVLLLAGCAAHGIRCAGRLVPVNRPGPAAVDAAETGAGAQPPRGSP